jgi:hypothetical protein
MIPPYELHLLTHTGSRASATLPQGPIRSEHFIVDLWSMIRKSGYRFSGKIMLKQKDGAG